MVLIGERSSSGNGRTGEFYCILYIWVDEDLESSNYRLIVVWSNQDTSDIKYHSKEVVKVTTSISLVGISTFSLRHPNRVILYYVISFTPN